MPRAVRARGAAAVAATAAGALLAGAAGLGVLASPAGAHISPDPAEVPAGAHTSISLTVGHGCDGSPTSELTVRIPEGVSGVSPQVHPGWDIETTVVPLDEPMEAGGVEVSERTSEVTFTAQDGNELSPDLRDTFTIGFVAPDSPGEHLLFRTIQTCVEGETGWVEEPTGEGGEPESPAPAVEVVEAEDTGHGSGDGDGSGETAAAGESAAADATGGSGDGGDSATGLAAAGLVAGILGLATGGFALFRTRNLPS